MIYIFLIAILLLLFVIVFRLGNIIYWMSVYNDTNKDLIRACIKEIKEANGKYD